MSRSPFAHQNDPALVRELLMDPGVWIIVGLSTNTDRTAYSIARWLKHEQQRTVIPVHPKVETVFGEQGYASLADVPSQDIKVVDCFVNSDNVGAVVDDVIANKDRLQIDAVWMQLGVIDQKAVQRAKDAGLDVVMDTCPKIEWRKISTEGLVR